jgi:hypothetical protein
MVVGTLIPMFAKITIYQIYVLLFVKIKFVRNHQTGGRNNIKFSMVKAVGVEYIDCKYKSKTVFIQV